MLSSAKQKQPEGCWFRLGRASGQQLCKLADVDFERFTFRTDHATIFQLACPTQNKATTFIMEHFHTGLHIRKGGASLFSYGIDNDP